ncbi:iron transporter [Methylobacterium sp. Leaf118]|uniref:iron transporter n=1 Tax=Methylobacterium sp. Leaf118 TaxID=2876562 RepID=UPI001E346F0D|nr:iron transporter [Methylobacterium sp. Leaf118]
MNVTKGSARPRLAEAAGLVGRVVLAAGGGYAVAALSTALLSATLPLPRSEAVTAATLASFAILASVAVLVFAISSLRHAAAAVLGAILVLGAGLWLAAGPLLSAGGAP